MEQFGWDQKYNHSIKVTNTRREIEEQNMICAICYKAGKTKSFLNTTNPNSAEVPRLPKESNIQINRRSQQQHKGCCQTYCLDCIETHCVKYVLFNKTFNVPCYVCEIQGENLPKPQVLNILKSKVQRNDLQPNELQQLQQRIQELKNHLGPEQNLHKQDAHQDDSQNQSMSNLAHSASQRSIQARIASHTRDQQWQSTFVPIQPSVQHQQIFNQHQVIPQEQKQPFFQPPGSYPQLNARVGIQQPVFQPPGSISQSKAPVEIQAPVSNLFELNVQQQAHQQAHAHAQPQAPPQFEQQSQMSNNQSIFNRNQPMQSQFQLSQEAHACPLCYLIFVGPPQNMINHLNNECQRRNRDYVQSAQCGVCIRQSPNSTIQNHVHADIVQHMNEFHGCQQQININQIQPSSLYANAQNMNSLSNFLMHDMMMQTSFTDDEKSRALEENRGDIQKAANSLLQW